MENENKELSELRTLYDELWSDAKTLVKDMKNSISIYLYAGLITLFMSVFAITFAVSYLSIIASGAGNAVVWSYLVVETAGAVVTIAFGAKLLAWYQRLRKRYSRLTKIEKTIGEK